MCCGRGRNIGICSDSRAAIMALECCGKRIQHNLMVQELLLLEHNFLVIRKHTFEPPSSVTALLDFL